MRILLMYVLPIFFLITMSACGNHVAGKTGINQSTIGHSAESKSEIENLTKKSSQYEIKQLLDADFEVVYNNLIIKDNTTLNILQNDLGYPKDYLDNNQGNISNGNGYRRWQLSYPDYDDSDISVILLSKQAIDNKGNEYHADTYIVGIQLQKIRTHKGLKVGDSLDKALELYGKPAIIQKYNANNSFTEFVYMKGGKKIELVFDKTTLKVSYIFIDYKMEQADRDQGLG